MSNLILMLLPIISFPIYLFTSSVEVLIVSVLPSVVVFVYIQVMNIRAGMQRLADMLDDIESVK